MKSPSKKRGRPKKQQPLFEKPIRTYKQDGVIINVYAPAYALGCGSKTVKSKPKKQLFPK